MRWIVICVDLLYDETYVVSRHRFRFAAHLKAWLMNLDETYSLTVGAIALLPRAVLW